MIFLHKATKTVMQDETLGNTTPYTFRPAALARDIAFHLDADELVAAEADGDTLWQLPLEDVAKLALIDHHMRGVRMRRLDLIDASGRILRSISRTEPTLAVPGDPEREAFEGLIKAVAGAIARRAPDTPVALGERGWPRLAMFAIGVVSLIAGAVIAFGGVSNGRLEALVPAGLLLLFGVVLAATSAPWRKPPHTTAAQLATEFGGGPVEDGPAAPRSVTPPPGG